MSFLWSLFWNHLFIQEKITLHRLQILAFQTFLLEKKKGLIISQRWFRCWTYGDEVALQPAFVIHGVKGCQLLPMVVHDSVVHIWVLSWGVISPDNHILHTVRGHTNTHRHLQAWRKTADEQEACMCDMCQRCYLQGELKAPLKWHMMITPDLHQSHSDGLWTILEYITINSYSRTKLDVGVGQ